MSEHERKDFEAWYSKRYGYKFHGVVSTWAHAAMCDAWEVWQAARAALAQQAVPHRANIEDAATRARKLAHGRDATGYRDALTELGRAYLAEFPTRAALAAQQAEREPLTDEQRELIANRASDKCTDKMGAALYAIAETERAHGIGKEGGSNG